MGWAFSFCVLYILLWHRTMANGFSTCIILSATGGFLELGLRAIWTGDLVRWKHLAGGGGGSHWYIAIGFLIWDLCGHSISLALCRCAISQITYPCTNTHTCPNYRGTPIDPNFVLADTGGLVFAIITPHLALLIIALSALILVVWIGTWLWSVL